MQPKNRKTYLSYRSFEPKQHVHSTTFVLKSRILISTSKQYFFIYLVIMFLFDHLKCFIRCSSSKNILSRAKFIYDIQIFCASINMKFRLPNFNYEKQISKMPSIKFLLKSCSRTKTTKSTYLRDPIINTIIYHYFQSHRHLLNAYEL
ncbi:unnamed protein product [Paramecium octaurelia]|uniref:Transmembrane protein n=1 Tax=Paramecium octaurelia TaxID=43137 RepID=A0A8S1WHJ2_PAROT|nr:unnamed protein product [Paramecium octaurelia]